MLFKIDELFLNRITWIGISVQCLNVNQSLFFNQKHIGLEVVVTVGVPRSLNKLVCQGMNKIILTVGLVSCDIKNKPKLNFLSLKLLSKLQIVEW